MKDDKTHGELDYNKLRRRFMMSAEIMKRRWGLAEVPQVNSSLCLFQESRHTIIDDGRNVVSPQSLKIQVKNHFLT